MTDTSDYLRGIDDALAEVSRRLEVDSKLGKPVTEYGMHRILDDTANRLRSGEAIVREAS